MACQPPTCSPPNSQPYCTESNGGIQICGCAPGASSDWFKELKEMDFQPGPPEERILTTQFFGAPLWMAATVLKQYTGEDFLVPASRLHDPVELPAEEMPLSEILDRLELQRCE